MTGFVYWAVAALLTVAGAIASAFLIALFKVLIEFYLIEHLPKGHELRDRALARITLLIDKLKSSGLYRAVDLKSASLLSPLVDITDDLSLSHSTTLLPRTSIPQNLSIARPYLIKFSIMSYYPKIFYSLQNPAISVTLAMSLIVVSMGGVVLASVAVYAVDSALLKSLLVVLGVLWLVACILTALIILLLATSANLAAFSPGFVLVADDKVFDLRARRFIYVEDDQKSHFQAIVEQDRVNFLFFKFTSYRIVLVAGKSRMPIYFANSLILLLVEHADLLAPADALGRCIRSIWSEYKEAPQI